MIKNPLTITKAIDIYSQHNQRLTVFKPCISFVSTLTDIKRESHQVPVHVSSLALSGIQNNTFVTSYVQGTVKSMNKNYQ